MGVFVVVVQAPFCPLIGSLDSEGGRCDLRSDRSGLCEREPVVSPCVRGAQQRGCQPAPGDFQLCRKLVQLDCFCSEGDAGPSPGWVIT